MAKYTQEVKDKAVDMAKQGVALKTIQSELGPNPKAVMRYLAKAGIDYKELREKLREEGKLSTATKKQGTDGKAKARKNKKSPKTEEVVEE